MHSTAKVFSVFVQPVFILAFFIWPFETDNLFWLFTKHRLPVNSVWFQFRTSKPAIQQTQTNDKIFSIDLQLVTSQFAKSVYLL